MGRGRTFNAKFNAKVALQTHYQYDYFRKWQAPFQHSS